MAWRSRCPCNICHGGVYDTEEAREHQLELDRLEDAALNEYATRAKEEEDAIAPSDATPEPGSAPVPALTVGEGGALVPVDAARRGDAAGRGDRGAVHEGMAAWLRQQHPPPPASTVLGKDKRLEYLHNCRRYGDGRHEAPLLLVDVGVQVQEGGWEVVEPPPGGGRRTLVRTLRLGHDVAQQMQALLADMSVANLSQEVRKSLLHHVQELLRLSELRAVALAMRHLPLEVDTPAPPIDWAYRHLPTTLRAEANLLAEFGQAAVTFHTVCPGHNHFKLFQGEQLTCNAYDTVTREPAAAAAGGELPARSRAAPQPASRVPVDAILHGARVRDGSAVVVAGGAGTAAAEAAAAARQREAASRAATRQPSLKRGPCIRPREQGVNVAVVHLEAVFAEMLQNEPAREVWGRPAELVAAHEDGCSEDDVLMCGCRGGGASCQGTGYFDNMKTARLFLTPGAIIPGGCLCEACFEIIPLCTLELARTMAYEDASRVLAAGRQLHITAQCADCDHLTKRKTLEEFPYFTAWIPGGKYNYLGRAWFDSAAIRAAMRNDISAEVEVIYPYIGDEAKQRQYAMVIGVAGSTNDSRKKTGARGGRRDTTQPTLVATRKHKNVLALRGFDMEIDGKTQRVRLIVVSYSADSPAASAAAGARYPSSAAGAYLLRYQLGANVLDASGKYLASFSEVNGAYGEGLQLRTNVAAGRLAAAATRDEILDTLKAVEAKHVELGNYTSSPLTSVETMMRVPLERLLAPCAYHQAQALVRSLYYLIHSVAEMDTKLHMEMMTAWVATVYARYRDNTRGRLRKSHFGADTFSRISMAAMVSQGRSGALVLQQLVTNFERCYDVHGSDVYVRRSVAWATRLVTHMLRVALSNPVNNPFCRHQHRGWTAEQFRTTQRVVRYCVSSLVIATSANVFGRRVLFQMLSGVLQALHAGLPQETHTLACETLVRHILKPCNINAANVSTITASLANGITKQMMARAAVPAAGGAARSTTQRRAQAAKVRVDAVLDAARSRGDHLRLAHVQLSGAVVSDVGVVGQVLVALLGTPSAVALRADLQAVGGLAVPLGAGAGSLVAGSACLALGGRNDEQLVQDLCLAVGALRASRKRGEAAVSLARSHTAVWVLAPGAEKSAGLEVHLKDYVFIERDVRTYDLMRVDAILTIPVLSAAQAEAVGIDMAAVEQVRVVICGQRYQAKAAMSSSGVVHFDKLVQPDPVLRQEIVSVIMVRALATVCFESLTAATESCNSGPAGGDVTGYAMSQSPWTMEPFTSGCDALSLPLPVRHVQGSFAVITPIVRQMKALCAIHIPSEAEAAAGYVLQVKGSAHFTVEQQGERGRFEKDELASLAALGNGERSTRAAQRPVGDTEMLAKHERQLREQVSSARRAAQRAGEAGGSGAAGGGSGDRRKRARMGVEDDSSIDDSSDVDEADKLGWERQQQQAEAEKRRLLEAELEVAVEATKAQREVDAMEHLSDFDFFNGGIVTGTVWRPIALLSSGARQRVKLLETPAALWDHGLDPGRLLVLRPVVGADVRRRVGASVAAKLQPKETGLDGRRMEDVSVHPLNLGQNLEPVGRCWRDPGEGGSVFVSRPLVVVWKVSAVRPKGIVMVALHEYSEGQSELGEEVEGESREYKCIRRVMDVLRKQANVDRDALQDAVGMLSGFVPRGGSSVAAGSGGGGSAAGLRYSKLMVVEAQSDMEYE